MRAAAEIGVEMARPKYRCPARLWTAGRLRVRSVARVTSRGGTQGVARRGEVASCRQFLLRVTQVLRWRNIGRSENVLRPNLARRAMFRAQVSAFAGESSISRGGARRVEKGCARSGTRLVLGALRVKDDPEVTRFMDGASTHIDLGAKILAAAQMAVAMHLYESVADAPTHVRQRVTIGGAGPRIVVTEDDLPTAAGRAAHPGAARPPLHP